MDYLRVASIWTLFGCGCASYAPPLRVTSPGAPTGPDSGEVRVAAGGVGLGGPPIAGGVEAGVGLSDRVSLEAGGTLGDGGDKFAMGWLGPRVSFDPRRASKFHLAGDLELAVGAGVGGSAEGGRAWHEQLAGGGMLGAGLAYHIHFFALYVRARGQAVEARFAPATLYATATTGLQFRIGRHVDLFADAGYVHLYNSHISAGGPVYRFGAAVRFGHPSTRDR